MEQTQDCCQDLGVEYNKQFKDKEMSLAAVNDRVADLVMSLTELDGRDMQQLLDDFTAATEAGEVTFLGEETTAVEAPEECQ